MTAGELLGNRNSYCDYDVHDFSKWPFTNFLSWMGSWLSFTTGRPFQAKGTER